MALKNIKEIIQNKGYVIKPQDRKIFEEGDLQSFFGFSVTDAIEFIIYDANDNQLPQLNGDLARYVNLTDENIRDYFLIPEGTEIQQYSLPSEYFIDVERLLNEAGYSNGIFKTQVTLINKRAGSEKEFDKLWIQEISPSRTEVRLFPLKQGVETNKELKERFEIFVQGLQFREDVLQIAFQVIEQISPSGVTTFIRGKYGERWYKNFIKEFKIQDIEKFVTQIHTTFLNSVLYEFTNRYSKIGTSEYGTKKLVNPPLSLTKGKIIESIKRILIETIYYYLPERDIRKNKKTTDDFLESEDFVEDVLQQESLDTEIPPGTYEITEVEINETGSPAQNENFEEAQEEIDEEASTNEEVDEENIEEPNIETPDGDPDIDEETPDPTEEQDPEPKPEPIIRGCTDPRSPNYNPLATQDDGSCTYPEDIFGCTDPEASNFNPNATIDDGSCLLPSPGTGGSRPPGGEGEAGQPPIGGGGGSGAVIPGENPEVGTKKTIYEL